jgi:hypothetical protein
MAIEELIKKNWELVPIGLSIACLGVSLYYAYRAQKTLNSLKESMNEDNKNYKNSYKTKEV